VREQVQWTCESDERRERKRAAGWGAVRIDMKARVFVTLKNGVLDPQGKAIGHALNGLGFGAVGDVRQGKVIDLDLAETDAAKAKASLKDMCEKLLANTVIEKYEIELR
jgi:phosphoribosylformylglycinamidine synthase PurS subunit